MKASEAKSLVNAAIDLMGVAYGRPVFDECVLIGLGSQGGTILFYTGPRADSFKKTFATDIAALKQAVAAKSHVIGDFEYLQDAEGSHYDAFIKTGTNSFLICNNTTQAMSALRADPRWVFAQKVFVDLGTKFAENPLEIE